MDPKKPNDPHSYVSTWLEQFQQAADVAPEVQKIYETQEWKRRTLEHRPTEAGGISTSQIDEWDKALYERLETNLPMLPTIDPDLVMEVSSTAASSDISVVEYLGEAAD